MNNAELKAAIDKLRKEFEAFKNDAKKRKLAARVEALEKKAKAADAKDKKPGKGNNKPKGRDK